jgi:hypothetical protein
VLLTIRLLSFFSWQGVAVCALVHLKSVGEILFRLRGVVDGAVQHPNVLVRVDFREEGVAVETLVHPRDVDVRRLAGVHDVLVDGVSAHNPDRLHDVVETGTFQLREDLLKYKLHRIKAHELVKGPSTRVRFAR